jgi:hypothetical protein
MGVMGPAKDVLHTTSTKIKQQQQPTHEALIAMTVKLVETVTGTIVLVGLHSLGKIALYLIPTAYQPKQNASHSQLQTQEPRASDKDASREGHVRIARVEHGATGRDVCDADAIGGHSAGLRTPHAGAYRTQEGRAAK